MTRLSRTGVCISLGLAAALAGCTPSVTRDVDPDSQAESDIQGGERARDRKNVFLLAVQTPERISYCGATLIAPSLLLTAAHCVHPAYVGDASITVQMAGQAYDEIGEARHGVATFDPQYVPVIGENGRPSYDFSLGHDMAVFQVDRPITRSTRDPQAARIRTTPLPESLVGTHVELDGFIDRAGRVQARASADMVVTEVEERGIHMDVTEDGGQACRGDSGGPTFATIDGVEYLVGVINAKRNAETGPCGDLGAFSARVDANLDFLSTFVPSLAPEPAPEPAPTPAPEN